MDLTVDTVTVQRGGSSSADIAVAHQVMCAGPYTHFLIEGACRRTSTICDCNDQRFIAGGTTADITETCCRHSVTEEAATRC